MKTTIINLSALVILLSTSFFAGRIDFAQDNEKLLLTTSDLRIESPSQSGAILTEAILINGEVVPVITLPELTIEASYTNPNLVQAIIKDGNVIPYVTLPTLNIEG